MQDTTREMQTIEREITLWTTRLVKGRKPDTLTQDIEATTTDKKGSIHVISAKTHTPRGDIMPTPQRT